MNDADYLEYLKHIENKVQNSLFSESHQIKAKIALEILDRKFMTEIALGMDEQDINDTVAVITSRPKLHALFFDRIDCQALIGIRGSSVPFEYTNRLLTYESCLFALLQYLTQILLEDPEFRDAHNTPEFGKLLVYLLSESTKFGLIGNSVCPHKIDEQLMVRRHSEELRKLYNVSAMPVYSSTQEFNSEYEQGSYSVTQRVIENLAIVDEDQLEWEQVRQFREDRDARYKYIQFLEFLKSKWSNKDINYYTYNIESKYREYEDSLKKHGIKTRLGLLKDIFSAKFILPTSLAALVTSATYPILTPIVAGTFAFGSLCLSIAEYKINMDSMTPPDVSIAWIYELKKAKGNRK